jgi:hypothetical protein
MPRGAPGDDFWSPWRVLDLLPEGPVGWQPHIRYGAERGTGRAR